MYSDSRQSPGEGYFLEKKYIRGWFDSLGSGILYFCKMDDYGARGGGGSEGRQNRYESDGNVPLNWPKRDPKNLGLFNKVI